MTNERELRALIGRKLGPTREIRVDQTRIDAFAAVGGDDQWIHVDPQRAALSGGTIAHGMLLLSLGPALARQLIAWGGVERTLQYGLERVRFPASLRAGRAVRMTLTVDRVEDRRGGLLMASTWTLASPGLERPVCVAEVLALVLFARSPGTD